jgi:phage-related protein|tara:strand:+ start:2836 stop:3177 length:342 start_codon:yes stop_codon:yes gene_type:complete
MKGETYIYAVNALAGADDGGVFKASDFLSAEIASASTVELRFKAGNNALKNSVVTLTLPANLGTESKLVFKNICKQISGLLNKADGKVFVLADEVNSVYMQPFTGTVTIDDVN